MDITDFYRQIGEHFPERKLQPPEPEPLTEEQRSDFVHGVVTGDKAYWWGHHYTLSNDDAQEIAEAVRVACALPSSDKAGRWDVVERMVMALAEAAANGE